MTQLLPISTSWGPNVTCNRTIYPIIERLESEFGLYGVVKCIKVLRVAQISLTMALLSSGSESMLILLRNPAQK